MNELSREGREEGRRKTLNQNSTNFNEEEIGKIILDSALVELKSVEKITSDYLGACLKMMKRVALAIAFYPGTVFSHPNAWFMRAAETVSPSPGGEGRGEGGLQTNIKRPFRIFRRALRLIPLKLGCLINFNEAHLKNGIMRVVNGLEGKSFFPPSQPSRSSRDTQLSAT